MGCPTCNWYNNLSPDVALAVSCSFCAGLGYLITTNQDQEVKQTCDHCQGTGTCYVPLGVITSTNSKEVKHGLSRM